MPISKIVLDNQSKENVDLDGQFVRIPHGTTAQRPSSPVGGQLRFNTDIGTLEQYNTSTNAWQAIDSPPIITSLAYSGSNTATDPAGGETITLTGSNFKAGATVTVGGTSANSVSIVSATSITFTTPAKTAGDYDVRVTNTNGLAATLTTGISYNGTPAFTTAAGNVGSVLEDEVMSTITIVAAEPDGGALAFSVTSGALPTGVSLGSANGQLTGTPNVNVTSNTTYNFTVTATDNESQTNSRAFNLIVLRRVYATEVGKSLMFNDGSSHNLTRTPSSAGNRRTWTWSAWVKRGHIGTRQILFSADDNATNATHMTLEFQADNNFRCLGGTETQSSQITKETSMEFNDQAAWYHLVFVMDATNTVARLYVNGDEITDWNTNNNPTNQDYQINAASQHFIGRFGSSLGTSYFDGIMANIHFIDGQALTPTSFAETHNGVWAPKVYSGSYGTNGWHLDFADSSAIGNDVSGQNNDWTHSSNDTHLVRIDSPTNNFCGLLGTGASSNFTNNVGNGNTFASTPNSASVPASFTINKGKWYWEVRVTGVGAPYLGIQRRGESRNGYTQGASAVNKVGDIYENQNLTGSDGLPSIAANDIIGVAVDHDATKIWYSKNGQWYTANNSSESTITIADVVAGNNGRTYTGIFQPNESADKMNVHPYVASSSGTGSFHMNFGNNPTFNGLVSAGTETDGNSQGVFKYPVPTGFRALCQKNLTQETGHNIDLNERPQNYFDTVLYTGNETARNITGLRPPV